MSYRYGTAFRVAQRAQQLQPQERTFLQLIVEGHSDREIAARLNLDPHHAEKNVIALLNKLGVKDRVQGALKALDEKLV